VHHYQGSNVELGTAAGKLYRVGVMSITDAGDSDLVSSGLSIQSYFALDIDVGFLHRSSKSPPARLKQHTFHDNDGGAVTLSVGITPEYTDCSFAGTCPCLDSIFQPLVIAVACRPFPSIAHIQTTDQPQYVQYTTSSNRLSLV
jgi:hypothetical protein